MTGTSPGAATATCAGGFTRQQQSCSRAADPNAIYAKWGLQLRERLDFKRATVGVARKLAVIMHSMLITGEPFREKTAAAQVPELVRVARHHETSRRDVG